jgi:hypothetical protein
MELGAKLANIQIEFKSKKSRYNSFGKYNFRSAEDILEGLKPFIEKYKVYFTINEQLINANPPMMSSVATIWDCESASSIDCQAVVGIDLNQKGMQVPQQFGTASSYAKKYALGNLLLIDDTLDADHGKVEPKEPTKELPKEKPILVIDTKHFLNAKKHLLEGGTLESIEAIYTLTAEVKTALTNK